MAYWPPVWEARLNTIGYVISRYGQLTGRDLEHLTHQETPWQRADQHRRSGESTRIELEWLEAYFGSDTQDDPAAVLDSDAISEWLAGAEDRRRGPSQADDPAAILARLAAG